MRNSSFAFPNLSGQVPDVGLASPHCHCHLGFQRSGAISYLIVCDRAVKHTMPIVASSTSHSNDLQIQTSSFGCTLCEPSACVVKYFYHSVHGRWSSTGCLASRLDSVLWYNVQIYYLQTTSQNNYVSATDANPLKA